MYVLRALLRLISVTLFSFTHPPVLSVLLLILSASRFPVPDFPLLVPALFVFGPSAWSDLPFPLQQKPSLDSIKSNLKTFLFPKAIDLPCFPFRAAVVLRSKSYFAVCLSCV